MMLKLFKVIYSIFLLFFAVFIYSTVYALEPDEVLVLANRNSAQSQGLALYYMEKRAIPKNNLLLVWITDEETCTRDAYEKKVVVPVKRFLETNSAGSKIRCIVSMFGLPLRIADPGLTREEKEVLTSMMKEKKTFEDILNNKKAIQQKSQPLNSQNLKQDNSQDSNKKIKKGSKHTGQQSSNFVESQDREKIVKKKLAQVNKRLKLYKRKLDKVASFDSELALVKKEDYDLKMWIPNPYYLGFRNGNYETEQSEVLMTSRLDGPSSDIVKRIIVDSIMAEKDGLTGGACFDARWKDPGKNGKKVSGYAFYDKSIHRAAEYIDSETDIKVKKDDTGKLFQPGDCLETALYCGWYSLARYVDAFTWQRGSVGYHIASSECATLKKKGSKVWCKKMIDKGIAATVGPVGEPYVQAFPVPEIFFKYLAEGYLTLAESYIISLPYLSWKMVLVGDPLYRVNLKL